MSIHPVGSSAMEMDDPGMRGHNYSYKMDSEKNSKKSRSWRSLIAGIVILLLAICLLVFIALLIYLGVKNSDLESKLLAQEKKAEKSATPSPVESTTETKVDVEHLPIKEDLNPNSHSAYRLSPQIRPVIYNLRLWSWLPNTIMLFTNRSQFTTIGELTILIHSLTQTGNISLNAQSSINIEQHTITIVEANSSGVELPNARRVKLLRSGLIEKPELEIVELRFDRDLLPDKYYLLSMKYHGVIGDAQMGYYRSSYTDESGRLRWIGATQFEVGEARQALPCFDEPSFKARFKITLIHPRDTTAISNSPALKQPNNQRDGWNETSFNETPFMSSYLLAWIVAPIEQAPSMFTSDGKIEFRAWSRPEMVPYLKYSSMAGRKVIEFFQDYFDIPFPLPKIDQVGLPDFSAGAMENWGLVTYREQILVYDESVNDNSDRQHTAEVIAHEMSHQWFGNLVTMKWWDDIWLNEGFATYMEMLGADFIENGTLKMDQQFVESLQEAMELDQFATTHPLSVPVKSADHAEQMFDKIIYKKGASILRMLNFTIGEQTFKKGVKQYLNDLSYKNADHDQLWDHFSKAAESNSAIKSWNNDPIDVKSMMNRWTLQAGFPVVTVTRDYSSNALVDSIKFNIHQSRFLINSTGKTNIAVYDDHGFGYKWHVPIWYQTPGNEIELTWLTPKESNEQRVAPSVDPSSDWLLVNPECRGFYRVNYDTRNWQLLTAVLLAKFETFDVRTRAMLLCDSFNLAKIGLVPYSIPFNMTTYLGHENSNVVWGTVMNRLSEMRELLLNHKDYEYEVFQKYLQRLYGTAYDKYGWEGRGLNLNDVMDAKLRENTVTHACLNGVPRCLENATAQYKAWVNSCDQSAIGNICIPNEIPKSLRQTVYCEAMKVGDSDTFNFLWGQFENETVQVEKDRLLSGLACAVEESLIDRLLSYLLDDTRLRANDAVYTIRKLATQPGGSQRIWKFMRSNWDIFNKKIFALGSGTVARLFGRVISQFNTDYNIEQFETLSKAYPEFFEKYSVVLNTVHSQLIANVQWVQEYGEPLLVTMKNFI